MNPKSGFAAFIAGKCPQCRKGDMFQYPLLRVSKFVKMNKSCSVCELQFEVEPGFFIGAMYFSYGMSVTVLISTGIFFFLFDLRGVYAYLFTVVVINLLLLPLTFRYSRIAFLYLFGGMKYKG